MGEATRLMSGHGLKLFGPGGCFFYRKRRQLGGGLRVGGGTEESRMVGRQRAGASHCQNTALTTSFEILSTNPLKLPIITENRKTAAQK